MPTNEEHVEIAHEPIEELNAPDKTFRCHGCGIELVKRLSYKLIHGRRYTYHHVDVRFCPQCGAKVVSKDGD